MPFVDRAHREAPDMNIPGDRCYVEFKWMMDEWRANPRWTTFDEVIAASIWPDAMERAKVLAFLVFFNQVVMPYEKDKEKQHGSI